MDCKGKTICQNFKYLYEEDKYLDELPERDLHALLNFQLHHMTALDLQQARTIGGVRAYQYLMLKAKEWKKFKDIKHELRLEGKAYELD
jgi:hypothetical protein